MKLDKIIHNTAEIKELVKGINLMSTGKIKPVKMELQELSQDENQHLTEELRVLYSACGCAQGRTSGVFTLVVFIVLVIAGVIPIQEFGTTKTMLIFLVCAVVAMFFGKVYGLLKGRRALLKFADEVEEKLKKTIL